MSMKVDFAHVKKQYQTYQSEIDSALADVTDSCRFILGPDCAELEKELASFSGASNAIVCSSGTDALVLSLMALGIGPGDEVITTPFTFIATAEAVALLGAKPVFVDILPDTYNLNPEKIEAAVTSQTRAIIGVSLYGQCADYDEINAIAQKHGLAVIEDACQSFGAQYKGRRSCSLTTLACTSFFPSKPLSAFGDGGAVFTSDAALADKITMLLNHGQNERYRHRFIGLNGRMDTMQAAVVRVKLRHFPAEVAARMRIGSRYLELLQDTPYILPTVSSDRTSVFAQFTLQTENRQTVTASLQQAGIPTAVHYPVPLYRQECFADLKVNPDNFPVSESVAARVFSIPMNAFLTEEEQDRVVQALLECV
jgi:UDP-2-acetamido-2-deoxy-ribo-hexuluronate aminotransferase